MAAENFAFANHNNAGGSDPHRDFSTLEFPSIVFSDASFNGTGLPLDLLSGGSDPHQALSTPKFPPIVFPDASFNGTGLPLDLLSDISDDVAEGLEGSPEFRAWMNDLGSLSKSVEKEVEDGGKNTKGRPMIPLTYEKLQQCKGRTLEAVANELNVSTSTLKRRFKKLTGYGKWSDFQQSKSFSHQSVHGKERMEDKVPIYVEYRGEKIPFDLPLTATLQLLCKHIKDSLKLRVGDYDIMYSDGKQDLFVRCSANLQFCLCRAVDAPIVLKVVKPN